MGRSREGTIAKNPPPLKLLPGTKQLSSRVCFATDAPLVDGCLTPVPISQPTQPRNPLTHRSACQSANQPNQQTNQSNSPLIHKSIGKPTNQSTNHRIKQLTRIQNRKHFSTANELSLGLRLPRGWTRRPQVYLENQISKDPPHRMRDPPHPPPPPRSPYISPHRHTF